MRWPNLILPILAPIAVLAATGAAHAGIVLSQVIVDLKPGGAPSQDIEVWNNGTDRSYVVAEPAEVVSPGKPDEHRVSDPDPSVSGLLVTPQRMILEAGERRLLRVAAVLPRNPGDRIYRVAVKPVAGDVTASATALKLMIGYDVLVIYRPEKLVGEITGERGTAGITFTNTGNTNVEMFEGRQCDGAGANCRDLPATRLYPGARLQVPLTSSAPVSYRIDTAGQSVVKTF